MKKIGVYFKTDYYDDFDEENVVYKNKKIEITDVELIEFKNGYLCITYNTSKYAGGQSTYNLDMNYVERYYIF